MIELPAKETREASYEAAGIYVLDRCDVLVAVWGGKGAQGQGGTGHIVAEARRRGIPLVWVHAGNRKPGTLVPTTLGEAQGRVTVEGPGDRVPLGIRDTSGAQSRSQGVHSDL